MPARHGPPSALAPASRTAISGSSSRSEMERMNLDELVQAAVAGDQAAWNELVERFQGLVWATSRSYRLSRADAADVAQTTWLRLVENLNRIHDPERLGAWLATTARRECLRHIRLHGREQLSDEPTCSSRRRMTRSRWRC